MANRASIKEYKEGFLGERAKGRGPLPTPPNPHPQSLEGEKWSGTGGDEGPACSGPLKGGWEGSLRRGRGDCVPPVLPSTNLILLATVHGDPAGYGRAWRIFEQVRPEVITVEISPFSVRYRERARASWRRRLSEALKSLPPEAERSLAVARVAAQADLPFEYRAARDWGKLHQVPVKLLDAGAVARLHLPRYADELLSPENLRFLWEYEASGTLEEFVAGEFRRARLAREGKLRLLPRPANPEDKRRERLWGKRLRGLVNSGKQVVHLGGWEHLVPWKGGGGLSQLLAHLKPCIMLLDEADRM
jgi:hypothetical protein